jgi:hypothetical protein
MYIMIDQDFNEKKARGITVKSVAEPDSHHFGGAGAAKQYDSTSHGSGSKLDVQHRWIIKCNKHKQFLIFLIPFYDHSNHKKFKEKVAPTLLLFLVVLKMFPCYRRVRAGSELLQGAGTTSK